MWSRSKAWPESTGMNWPTLPLTCRCSVDLGPVLWRWKREPRSPISPLTYFCQELFVVRIKLDDEFCGNKVILRYPSPSHLVCQVGRWNHKQRPQSILISYSGVITIQRDRNNYWRPQSCIHRVHTRTWRTNDEASAHCLWHIRNRPMELQTKVVDRDSLRKPTLWASS